MKLQTQKISNGVNKIAVICIEAYQKILSPDKNIFWKRAPSCKFFPSCSDYSKEAFSHFGFFTALLYSIKRILRCNPFSRGGYDPVWQNRR